MGTSGLMSGEWKRSEWRDTQTPATERAGHSYGPPSRHRATPRLHKLRGALFSRKRPAGATKENIPGGSSTEEQRSQTAFCPKTLRAAGLLPVASVGSFLTARCGDARNSPPWPQPKSLAAAPLVVSKQALRLADNCRIRQELPCSPEPGSLGRYRSGDRIVLPFCRGCLISGQNEAA